MEPDPRWRSPGSSSWYSPRYRGGGGGSGGFRGNNYSPRQNFGNNWQQRSQSPYNYRHQHQGSPYKNFNNAPYSSTPRHQNWGGGGRGRQHHRNSFGGSPRNSNSFGQDSIENWVSPQMWEDPWKNLLTALELTDTKSQSQTKFADTDFSMATDSENKSNSNIAVDTTKDTTTNLSTKEEEPESILEDDSAITTPIINEDPSPADIVPAPISATTTDSENEVPVSITLSSDANVDSKSEIDVPV